MKKVVGTLNQQTEAYQISFSLFVDFFGIPAWVNSMAMDFMELLMLQFVVLFVQVSS